MFESERYIERISYSRGQGWSTNFVETEIIHRTPSSDDGWCFFESSLSWWDGSKGVCLILTYGQPELFSKMLGNGADYRTLSKYHLPNSELQRISCEGMIGRCEKCWAWSEPKLVSGNFITVVLHKNWEHLYLQANKARILGSTSLSPKLESVRSDHQLTDTFISKVLGFS